MLDSDVLVLSAVLPVPAVLSVLLVKSVAMICSSLISRGVRKSSLASILYSILSKLLKNGIEHNELDEHNEHHEHDEHQRLCVFIPCC